MDAPSNSINAFKFRLCYISGTTGWAFSWTRLLSPYRPCWLHRLPVGLHKVYHKVYHKILIVLVTAHNCNEPNSILARFRPSACPSARRFVIYKNSSGDEIANVNFFTTISYTFTLAQLYTYWTCLYRAPRKPRPAAARAVYCGPQLAACRLCLPRACRARPSVHPSHARGHTSQQFYYYILKPKLQQFFLSLSV